MSYDYVALTAKIASSRLKASNSESSPEEVISALQGCINAATHLSDVCPMTPLLWMQYAADTFRLLEVLSSGPANSLDARLQVLELGVDEFPGSAILQLHYLELLCRQTAEMADEEKILTSFDTALSSIASGSHRNEGAIVVQIYRLFAKYRAEHGMKQGALRSFVQRASVPIKDENDGLQAELQEFCQEHKITPIPNKILKQIEAARRNEAKLFSALATFEDEIDAIMHEERVLARHQVSLDHPIDWDVVVKTSDITCWSGYGGMGTALAFIKYARFCSKYRLTGDDETNKALVSGMAKIKDMAVAVYERGVAECPTIETIWLAYATHLEYNLVRPDPEIPIKIRTAKVMSVMHRAVRNCPYSLKLFQKYISLNALCRSVDEAGFDPDDVTKIVTEATDLGFITDPAQCVELHMTAIAVVRRHILRTLAPPQPEGQKSDKKSKKAFDGVEPVAVTKDVPCALDANAQSEIKDLCEDLLEMYDTADAFIKKKHTSFSKGRACVWLDRAQTETHLCGPILSSLEGKKGKQSESGKIQQVIQAFSRVTKVHKPAHPDAYLSYIREFMSVYPATSPSQVAAKLRQARYLFQDAIKSVGPGKQEEAPQVLFANMRDYYNSLDSLCNEYLSFERYFGSDESLAQAEKVVQKKIRVYLAKHPQPIAASNETAIADQSGQNETQSAVAVSTADSTMDVEEPQRADKSETSAPKRTMAKEDDDDDEQQASKRQKVEAETPVPAYAPTPTVEKMEDGEAADKKKESHVVRIGKLEYPAHPYTVRVSNLASEVEDMDLIDLLRQKKCGSIVHAKIVREKTTYGKGKSKGWGLVQFEEKESVENALQLNDVVGLHEKLIGVQRSHMPAVSLVPAGMHRVNEKGQGKSSKQNLKRKQEYHCAVDKSQGKEADAKEDKETSTNSPTEKDSKPSEKPKKKQASVLSLQPRRVNRGTKQRKAKLNLGGASLADKK